MILSLRIKNFYSLRDEVVIDFTANMNSRNSRNAQPNSLIDFHGDKFVNIIGLFGGNAAGKSNLIKAMDYCRNLILTSHLNNEGDELGNVSFKFGGNMPSEFYIDFVTDGIEYEYSFEIYGGVITSEELYYYPNKRKSRIFSRTETTSYYFKKGVIPRPSEVVANTGPKTLFLSRASSMQKEIAQKVFRFFLNEMMVGRGSVVVSNLSVAEFENDKNFLLMGIEVCDSDIIDITLSENMSGQLILQSFHRENPELPFDFIKEESDGTKSLLTLLIIILRKITAGATFFIDEFDLKLHLRLAEFILDLVRSSKSAQMVFTSHNPLLIDTDSLRPEQIVFVSKQSDGNSEFVSLAEFVGINKIKDIRQAYLQGRFDGVPYIGSARSLISEITLNHEKA